MKPTLALVAQTSLLMAGVALSIGCRTTKPATHVEIVDNDGVKTYVGGAAGPGVSQTAACQAAVRRAVNAIALRFSQDFEDVGEKLAEKLGAQSGAYFLQGYAKANAAEAAVQDVRFDPSEHICMATVRWKPPVFLEDAITAYATKAKQEETASASSTSNSSASQADAAPKAPVDPCAREKRELKRKTNAKISADEDYDRCLSKSNETACTRYKLYVDEADRAQTSAKRRLQACESG